MNLIETASTTEHMFLLLLHKFPLPISLPPPSSSSSRYYVRTYYTNKSSRDPWPKCVGV